MIAFSMSVKTLNQFVRDVMKRREIKSNRRFAELTGINHQIINDMVNDTYAKPDMGTLVKLSNYTGTSIMTLFALAFPEAKFIEVDPDALLDAEKISKLPPEKQAIARGYIADAFAESEKK